MVFDWAFNIEPLLTTYLMRTVIILLFYSQYMVDKSIFHMAKTFVIL